MMQARLSFTVRVEQGEVALDTRTTKHRKGIFATTSQKRQSNNVVIGIERQLEIIDCKDGMSSAQRMEYGFVPPNNFRVGVIVSLRVRRRAARRPIWFRFGDGAMPRVAPGMDHIGVNLVFVSIRVSAIDCVSDIMIRGTFESHASSNRPIITRNKIDFGLQFKGNVI